VHDNSKYETEFCSYYWHDFLTANKQVKASKWIINMPLWLFSLIDSKRKQYYFFADVIFFESVFRWNF